MCFPRLRAEYAWVRSHFSPATMEKLYFTIRFHPKPTTISTAETDANPVKRGKYTAIPCSIPADLHP